MNNYSISGSGLFISGLRSLRVYRHLALLLLLCASPLLQAVAQANLQPSEIELNSLTLNQLQQAADAGDPDAQYALGYMYYYGKHVPQNTQTALNWMKRAAVQGQSQAINAMALLGQNVPAPQPPSMAYPEPQTNPPPANARVGSTPKALPPNRPAAGAITVTTTTTVVSANEPPLTKASSGHYYTLQLLGASNKGALNNYINTYHLQNQATYYQTKHQGKNWYVLVYGNYKTRAAAQAAIATLPAGVRAQKPWVKLIGSTETEAKVSTNSTAKKAKPHAAKGKSVKTKEVALPF